MPCWLLRQAAFFCAIADEDFIYGDRKHFCSPGPNVLNVFSFSKVGTGLVGYLIRLFTTTPASRRHSVNIVHLQSAKKR